MKRKTIWKAALATASCLAVAAGAANAQDPPSRREPARARMRPQQTAPEARRPPQVLPETREVVPAPTGDAEVRAVGPEIHDDFNFPNSDRPWGRGRYLDPYPRHGGYYHQRRRSGHRRYYYDDYSYRSGVPYGDPIEDDLERAYRQGVSDGRNYEHFEIQAEHGLGAYLEAMNEGHDAFFQGRYGRAARSFLLAAELNQGDPSARLCAAHCETALKRYEPAARLVHRALELQPKIVYLPLDIRGSYGVPGEFDRHAAALETAVQRDAEHAGLRLLLGYYHYFAGRPADAARALAKAAELAPDDRVIRRFARVVSMSVPASHRD